MSILGDIELVTSTFYAEYAKTPTKLKAIDLFILYALLTAAVQFLYMVLVGSFPFNAFLAGLFACIGTAVLAVCLRMQANKENTDFKTVEIAAGEIDLPTGKTF